MKVDDELFNRLADRYTPAELVDDLDIPIEALVELLWDKIIESETIMEEVGCIEGR